MFNPCYVYIRLSLYRLRCTPKVSLVHCELYQYHLIH